MAVIILLCIGAIAWAIHSLCGGAFAYAFLCAACFVLGSMVSVKLDQVLREIKALRGIFIPPKR